MQISQIKFIETDDAHYQISFIYKGSNLQSGNILRAMTQSEVANILRVMCTEFDGKRAQTNFDALKLAFEGKTVTI